MGEKVVGWEKHLDPPRYFRKKIEYGRCVHEQHQALRYGCDRFHILSDDPDDAADTRSGHRDDCKN